MTFTSYMFGITAVLITAITVVMVVAAYTIIRDLLI